jgi:hypothetical protein
LIEALILICALNVTAQSCDAYSAEDVIRLKVEPVVCALASQSAIAGLAGDRSQGQFIKIVCGGRG